MAGDTNSRYLGNLLPLLMAEGVLSSGCRARSLHSGGLVVTDLGVGLVWFAHSSLKCNFQWHMAVSVAEEMDLPKGSLI